MLNSAMAGAIAAAARNSGEAWSDGTLWSDGTGWIDGPPLSSGEPWLDGTLWIDGTGWIDGPVFIIMADRRHHPVLPGVRTRQIADALRR